LLDRIKAEATAKGWTAEPARGSTAATLEWRMRRLGVPLEAIENLRSPWNTRAREAAAEFCTAPHAQDRFLLLAGNRGVGKTVAAAWLLRQQLLDGHPGCLWVPATDFTSMSAYDGKVERLERVALLVVDDIGRESKGFARDLLSGVLLRRYEEMRRTVLTTNAAPSEMQTLYGQATWDRIRTGMVVPLDGPSFRGRTTT
jgi:DNA replication protein DnaC